MLITKGKLGKKREERGEIKQRIGRTELTKVINSIRRNRSAGRLELIKNHFRIIIIKIIIKEDKRVE